MGWEGGFRGEGQGGREGGGLTHPPLKCALGNVAIKEFGRYGSAELERSGDSAARNHTVTRCMGSAELGNGGGRDGRN